MKGRSFRKDIYDKPDSSPKRFLLSQDESPEFTRDKFDAESNVSPTVKDFKLLASQQNINRLKKV